jgi:hypothetical protein
MYPTSMHFETRKLLGNNRWWYRSFTMKSEDFWDIHTLLLDWMPKAQKIRFIDSCASRHTCVYTFDALDFEFDMLCRSLNPAETAWFFYDRLQLIEWQKDHWALKQRGMNECYNQETLLGGTKFRRNDYLTLARCQDP